MTTMPCTRMEEQPDATAILEPSTDLSPFIGTWINTNPEANGIVKLVLAPDGDGMTVQIFGAGDSDPLDWGDVPAQAFSEGVSSNLATAFTAFYDFDFMDVLLQTYLAKGVLVVVSYTHFKDGSGRSSYFNKEFYYRQ